MLKSSDQLSSILSGRGIDLKTGEVSEPGFYWRNGIVEHWSLPCAYNEVMRSHFSNADGFIMDGFYSSFGCEDVEQFADKIKSWKEYLIRNGVES